MGPYCVRRARDHGAHVGDHRYEHAHGVSRRLRGYSRRARLLGRSRAGDRPARGMQKKFDRQDHGHAHSSGRTTARAPTPPVPTARVPRTPQGFLRRRVDLQGRTAAALHTRLEGLRAPQVWLPAGGPPEEQVSDAEDQT